MKIRKTPSLYEQIKYKFAYKNAYKNFLKVPQLNFEELNLVKKLRQDGFVMMEDFIDAKTLDIMKCEFQSSVESLDFKFPCFGQSLVEEKAHADLIENFFYCTDDELSRRGLVFNKNEICSLEDAVLKYNPSNLTTFMLEKSHTYRAVYLDERILRIVASYMGLVPNLTEAYVRRSFPAPFKVMNHFWHRDLNHKFYLLKAFLFLTDCEIDNGPHEYIRGTHKDLNRLNGKRYFEDSEVDLIYPQNSEDRIVSKVKAGTLIIEDTRGLHRAKMPVTGYRDLCFAVFMPDKNSSNFTIKQDSLGELSDFQKMFIAKTTII